MKQTCRDKDAVARAFLTELLRHKTGGQPRG